MLDIILDKQAIGSTDIRLFHIKEIAKGYLQKIQRLEKASPFSFLGTALSKKEDRMAECAKIYLKLGNFKEYCEILVSLSKKLI